jgi:hypothetical protein
MVVAAVVGGVAAIGGAVITSNAASDAAKAQERAAAAGVAQQDKALEYTKSIMKPYVDAGHQALPYLQGSLGIGTPEENAKALSAFYTSPDYAYAVEQGQQAVTSGAKVTGMGLHGGGVLDELQKRRMGLATQNLNNWRSGVSDLMGQGRTSAGFVADQATGTARAQSDTLNAGAARASAYKMQGAQAISDGISDVGSLASYAYAYDRGYRPGGR